MYLILIIEMVQLLKSNCLEIKSILVIDNNLPYLLNDINFRVGGASVQTLSWIRGFEELGYKIFIGSPVCLENKSKYKIFDTGRYYHGNPIIKAFMLLYKSLIMIFIIKPNFIYISTPCWINIFIIFSSFFSHSKVIQRISNDNLVDNRSIEKFGKKKNLIYKWTLKMASLILCQNEYQYTVIKKQYPEKRIMKLTNPFFFERRGRVLSDRSYVAWVGLFQYQKNMPALLKIVKELPHISFKIAGEQYENIDEDTKEAIICLEKQKNVKFVGLVSRPKMASFLSQASCLLNTSYYEGFSNTFLESFSVNTPVVTRKITDPDNIIKNYKLGIVVDNYLEIPKAIKSIISNSQDYSHLTAYLKKNHQPKIIAKQLICKIEKHFKID
tara:strand:- start:5963 stop:7114 length:1152 start_codon:yes stop_codon:yes gene_type:complete